MNLKLLKFKGGKINLKKQLYGLNKKMGGAAVKKLSEEDIKSMDSLSLGGSVTKQIKSRSIKPLNFKL